MILLAAASIGAVLSTASPDFGVRGVIDRFGQVEPRLLFVTDGYSYRGKRYETLERVPSHTRRASHGGADGGRAECGRGARHAIAAHHPPQRIHRPIRCGPNPLRPPPLRPPPLHPLLIRHHRRAEVHRPSRGRRPAPAPQGAPAPLRHPARRPGLLLHHPGMDDVELAGLGAGVGSHHPPLRRLPRPPGQRRALRLRRGHRNDAARHLARLPGRGAQSPASAPARPTISPRCGRSSRPARLFRRRASSTSTTTSSPDVHLASVSGGTDLCACFVGGIPTRPVRAGEIQGPCPGHGHRCLRRRWHPSHRGQGRAGLHPALPVAAAGVRGR